MVPARVRFAQNRERKREEKNEMKKRINYAFLSEYEDTRENNGRIVSRSYLYEEFAVFYILGLRQFIQESSSSRYCNSFLTNVGVYVLA